MGFGRLLRLVLLFVCTGFHCNVGLFILDFFHI